MVIVERGKSIKVTVLPNSPDKPVRSLAKIMSEELEKENHRELM